MTDQPTRRRRSPFSHSGGGSDSASDVSSWVKSTAFATPDNLQAAAIQLQSSLRDVAQTLNCIYNLLQRLQHEQLLKDDAQSEHRRLRQESQTYEQNLSRLRKEIDVKERDIATLRIRGRQEVDRHAEDLSIMVRDRDALQKHCNNLTRRQIQFQHEIRRKELQYEWLQEKLRNYLAERKRESSASMEIVGLLRQQSPQQAKDKSKIAVKIDEMMPGRSGNAKKSTSRAPKLDETMVKMIVTAYEEKQKELVSENEDLQEALNSIRKEYTNLMNAQLKNEASSRSLGRMDSKIYTTKCEIVEAQSNGEESKAALDARTSGIPLPAHRSSLQSSTNSEAEIQPLGTSQSSSPTREKEKREAEGTSRLEHASDPAANERQSEIVPWPTPEFTPLRSVQEDGEKKKPSFLDTAENSPVLPTVSEERDATTESVKETETIADSDAKLDADQFAKETDRVLSSLSIQSQDVETDVVSCKDDESTTGMQKRLSSTPGEETEEGVEKRSSFNKNTKKIDPGTSESPESRTMRREVLSRMVWPPPSLSPQPRDEPSPIRPRPSFGKIPQPVYRPMPNIALMTDEQLKTELRSRAVDVEESVRALKTACSSMQPQHMKSVMEKRLHVELTMAANLAEQQEAVVNLALAGLEKVKRTIPGSDLDLEELASAVGGTLDRSEALMYGVIEKVAMTTDAAASNELQHDLEEIMTELRQLREKATAKHTPSSSFKDSASIAADNARELEKNISSLRERADGLTKEKELINRALGDLDDQADPPPSRRTWNEKAEQDEGEAVSVISYSDDETAPRETLSQILHD